MTIDPGGGVRITDRVKNLIKSGGEWISSVDLENALLGHPAVREAAVVAVAHPRWGERPVAAVVIRDGAEATAEELRAYLAPRFATFWLPDAFVFVPQIPRTATGKFQKTVLRELLRQGPPAVGAAERRRERWIRRRRAAGWLAPVRTAAAREGRGLIRRPVRAGGARRGGAAPRRGGLGRAPHRGPPRSRPLEAVIATASLFAIARLVIAGRERPAPAPSLDGPVR